MTAATPGEALRDVLAALGWSVLPWSSMTPAEREGMEGAARATVAAAANGLLAAAGASLEEVTAAVTASMEGTQKPTPATAPHDALAALTRVTGSHERVMFAAAIDIRRGEPGEARRLLGEELDGWDGPQWDGTETGAQYLERTREGA